MVAPQRHVLPELEDRGAISPDRDATGLERDVSSIRRDDFAVDVQLGAPIGTKVQVVDAPDRPLELAAADRTVQVEVEARTLGWRGLACEHGVGRDAVLHGLRDLRPVLIDQLSCYRRIGVIGAKADVLRGRLIESQTWLLSSCGQASLTLGPYVTTVNGPRAAKLRRRSPSILHSSVTHSPRVATSGVCDGLGLPQTRVQIDVVKESPAVSGLPGRSEA